MGCSITDAWKRRLLLGDIVVWGKSTGGAKENRRGVTPPAPERSEEPPVQEHQRNKSPEGATEYLTCLISTCIYFCRPLGAFSVVASLPGACAPVCGLSSLWDFRVSPLGCFSSGKPNNRRISRGALNYPRTTIIRKLPYNGRIPCEFLGLRIRYLPMEWAFFAVLPYGLCGLEAGCFNHASKGGGFTLRGA